MNAEKEYGPLTADEARQLSEHCDRLRDQITEYSRQADRQRNRADSYRRALILVLASRNTKSIEQALETLLTAERLY